MFVKFPKFIVVFGLVGVLASCAAGRDFQRPAPASLTLGETTKSEVIARYGDPWKSGSLITNGQSVEQIAYAYSGGGDPLVSGVTPARALDLYFHNQVLVGYFFASTFKSDHTDFDHDRISLIKEGESCGKVSEIFGPPPGKAIYPMADEKDATDYYYGYPQTKIKIFDIEFYMKFLSIVCDKNGNITSVAYAESGER